MWRFLKVYLPVFFTTFILSVGITSITLAYLFAHHYIDLSNTPANIVNFSCTDCFCRTGNCSHYGDVLLDPIRLFLPDNNNSSADALCNVPEAAIQYPVFASSASNVNCRLATVSRVIPRAILLFK